MKMHRTSLRLLNLAVALASALTANAEQVSTCFTYQGQLRNINGTLVNTPQDFRVTLYPQSTGGGPVGNPGVNQSNCVPVVNGLFTLTLCFGDPSSYRCEARWLEIEVRPCGSGASFQVLTQRVQLLPTPYAIQSLSACLVEPNGVSSAALQDGAVTGTKIADGAIASAKVNASTFGTTFWKTDGNAGTTAGANFLGTTDDQALELKVRGARALRLQPHGAGNSSLIGGYFQNSVGAPGAVIAGGGTQGSINAVEGDYGFVGAGHGAHAGNLAAVVGGAYNSALGQFSFVGTGLENTNLGSGSVIVGGSKNLVMTLGQNAVIGGGQQNISSGEHATVPGGFQNSAGGAVSFAAGNRAKANHQGTFVWADSQNADFTSSENDEFSIRAAGGVRMVGAGLVSSGTENGVQGNSANPIASGVFGENTGQGYGVAGRTAGTGAAVFGDNLSASGWAGYFNGRLGVAGKVGIGTTTPLRTLHVQGHEIHSGGASAGFSFGDRTASGFVEIPNGTGERWVWYSQNGTASLWSGDNKISVQPNGNVSVCSLTIRGGCDLAEPFEMSDHEIPKGSLVVIDEENAGKLKLAGQEYDTRVAGVISGANGLNPGISLHQEGLIEGGQNVALSGRVYALADASNSSIKPGDLLTSSSTPGHVMKVTDHTRAQGAIVGKAMSALKDGKGMVLVLVSLQ